jgi:hypothetical protein
VFGYPIEKDFDPDREQRGDRVGWGFLIGGALAIAYDLFGGPFGVEVFQAALATTLFYGANFYADRRNDARKEWFWVTLFATTPLHVAYLVALIWSDRAFPEVMTKAIVFIPVILVGFGIESLLVDWAAKRFKSTDHTAGSRPG